MTRIALSVVFIGLGVAVGLLVSSGRAEPANAARGPEAENVTALRNERRDILRDAVDQVAALYRHGKADQASCLRLTLALLNSDLELAPDQAARIALRRQAVNQLKAMEEMAGARVESARGTKMEVLEVQAARIQVEIDLALDGAARE